MNLPRSATFAERLAALWAGHHRTGARPDHQGKHYRGSRPPRSVPEQVRRRRRAERQARRYARYCAAGRKHQFRP